MLRSPSQAAYPGDPQLRQQAPGALPVSSSPSLASQCLSICYRNANFRQEDRLLEPLAWQLRNKGLCVLILKPAATEGTHIFLRSAAFSLWNTVFGHTLQKPAYHGSNYKITGVS